MSTTPTGAWFPATLMACAGTWLEQPPDAAEQARINAARRALQAHRAEADAFGADHAEAARFSLELFRDPRFAPLAFADRLVASIIEQHGEPPVAESDDDPSFSDYLHDVALSVSSGRLRRALVEQVQRFIPQYVEAGQIREALAIEYNIHLTNYGEGSSPLIVQLLLAALVRWYDEREGEE